MDAYWIDPGHNNFCCGTVYLSTLRNCYSETWPVCSRGKSDLIAEMCRTLIWQRSWMLGQGLGSIDLRGENEIHVHKHFHGMDLHCVPTVVLPCPPPVLPFHLCYFWLSLFSSLPLCCFLSFLLLFSFSTPQHLSRSSVHIPKTKDPC